MKNEMGWACGVMGEEGVYRVLVGKPEGRDRLGDRGVLFYYFIVLLIGSTCFGRYYARNMLNL